MPTRAVLVSLLLLTAGIPLPAQAQGSTVDVTITFAIVPDEGQVDVRFEVEDPGPLKTIRLRMGDLDSLQGSAVFEGDWKEENGQAIAEFDEEQRRVAASWTSNGRIKAQTLEGEGHTTYVGEDFSVIKTGDMVPGIQYSYRGEDPAFDTDLRVEIPQSWSVRGPWATQDGGFQLDRPLPRGFLAAGPDVDEVQLGSGEDAYDIVRVAGAQEDETTERILLEARSFLAGIWGKTAHQRFIVVAPSPMFRGGLGSPAGVFLHDDADANVVAHEMVHAYQGFRFSRAPGEATIWLAEGTAVAHGALLEVAAGVKTREEARDFLQERKQRAEDKWAVALTSAVHGSGNEQAAYTKGAVVVTQLDDRIREETANQYTFSDVLKELNRRGAADDRFEIETSELASIIREETDYDPGSFFEEYIFGSSVPALGSIFPGELSIRILGTNPSPPVAGQPFEVQVRVTNLDTRETTADVPVQVNGTERGRLVATLAAGETANAHADVEALDRGSYELQIQGARSLVDVRSPAEPSVNITLWPQKPHPGENVTVGARIANAGEAPYRETVTIEVDGHPILEEDVVVASDEVRTVTRTLAPLAVGSHTVEVFDERGEALASRSFEAREPEAVQTPAAGALLALTLIALVARLWPARGPR